MEGEGCPEGVDGSGMSSVTRGVGGNTGTCLADRTGFGRAWNGCGGLREGRQRCLD